MTINQLSQPVQQSFDAFKQEYQRRTSNTVSLINEVEAYLAQNHGKQLRPLMVLLAAEACNNLCHNHVLIAAIVEMLHNATLMHDDVVDEAPSRRGHDSVRQRWGNQVAVLCGDYYLAQTMKALYEMHDDNVTAIINNAVITLCEGELKQLANAGTPLSEEHYIDIIGSKTAALFAACCELGACGSGNPDALAYRHPLHQFGYHYGIVFQIRDDLHDSDFQHDATLSTAIDPIPIIDRHTRLAVEALDSLPDTPARQSLLSLLLPSAPQPTNS